MKQCHWLLVLIAASAAAVEEAYVPLTGYDTTYTITAPGGHDVAVFVKKGDTVKVHATGIVEESGKKFWSTKDPGQQPFQYQAGVGGVIVGWDQGCLGMKLGETRKLRIPAHEGYGKGGFPAWGIPPGGTLLFEIEVLEVAGQRLSNLRKKKIKVGGPDSLKEEV